MVTSLDTNVLIDLIRGHPVVRRNYEAAVFADLPLAMSVVVLEELMFGVERHASPARERTLLDPIVAKLEIVPFERADAESGSLVRARMASAGRSAPYSDFLIGAHALARGHTLVTANTKDFQNIPGLQLVDWTKPPQIQDAPHA